MAWQAAGLYEPFDFSVIDPRLLEMDSYFELNPPIEATLPIPEKFQVIKHSAAEDASGEHPECFALSSDDGDAFDEHPECFALSSDDEDAKRVSKVRGRLSGQRILNRDEFVVFTDSEIFSGHANACRQVMKRKYVNSTQRGRRVSLGSSLGDTLVVSKRRTIAKVVPSSNRKRAKRKGEAINDDDDSEEADDFKPRAKRYKRIRASAPKSKRKREPDDDSEEDEDSEPRAKRSRQRTRASAPKRRRKRAPDDDEDDIDSEEDSDFKPRAKRSRKQIQVSAPKRQRRGELDDDDDSEENDDFEPRAKTSRRQVQVSAPKSKEKKRSKALHSQLQQPLSKLLDYIPVVDVESLVNRATEIRKQEIPLGKIIPRPLNAFILYRKAYQIRCKEFAKTGNHRMVSTLAGESWNQESKSVKQHFANLAQVEQRNHKLAFPAYKFSPRERSKTSKRKRAESVDSEIMEPLDLPELKWD